MSIYKPRQRKASNKEKYDVEGFNFTNLLLFLHHRYKKLLRDARIYELERHDIILCTCTTSSTPSLTKTVSARQILIDECAMATEPQALIPLVCNKPEKVCFSLIDHYATTRLYFHLLWPADTSAPMIKAS